MSDDNVVQLHPIAQITGTAKCRACNHKFDATEPKGSIFFECPECKEFKAVFMGTHGAGAGEYEFACPCGSHDFYVHKKTMASTGQLRCRMCGGEITGWFE